MSANDDHPDDSSTDLMMSPQALAPSALEALTRGEIDVQIATARRFRRNLDESVNYARRQATSSKEMAEATFYKLKRKDNRTGEIKVIEGPSIRLAEIMANAWGNLRYGARPISDDGKVVTVQGVCHDLERNVYLSVEVQRRITDRNGRRYSDDMVAMTVNAACAIARRNAVIGVIPRIHTERVMREARTVAIGTAASLEQRRGEVVEHVVKKLGVDLDRVLAALGRAAVAEITLDDLETLVGLKTAVADGDTTLDEAFPPVAPPPAEAKESLAERVRGGKKEKPTPEAGREPGAEG